MISKREKVKEIRVKPGEKTRIRLVVEGEYCVEGYVDEFARELYSGAYRRLLSSKSSRRRRDFVGGRA